MNLHNANVAKVSAQYVGLRSVPVEVKNLVWEDLPFDGKEDSYLEVECEDLSPMASSVQESMLLKVVHIPEIFTLQMRNSPIEHRVRCVAKELNVCGSDELCEVCISPQTIFDWRDDKKGPMWFRMDIMDRMREASMFIRIFISMRPPTWG